MGDLKNIFLLKMISFRMDFVISIYRLVKSFTHLFIKVSNSFIFNSAGKKDNSKRLYSSLSEMSWGEMLFKFNQIFPPKNLKIRIRQ